MRLNVLLVAGGGFQGQGLADVVRLIPDARVIIVDSVADNIGKYIADRYIVAPLLSNRTRFREFLFSVVKDERVDLVLPCTNRELGALASVRKELAHLGARVAVSDEALLDVLRDKLATHQHLHAAGIPTQLPVLLAEGQLPLFGKPRSGWGGTDTRVVRSVDDLRRLDLQEVSASHCWVPLLQGFEEFSADFAIGFHQELSPVTLRKRVRTSGGFAVISDSIFDESVMGIVEKVARWLVANGGLGIFNVQVLRTAGGEMYVSDVNPRHGTSSGHAAAEGNHLVRFLLGGESTAYREPVRSIRTLAQRSWPLAGKGCWAGVVFDLDDTLIDHKRWMMDKLRLAAEALAPALEPAVLLRLGYAVVEEGPHDRMIDVLAERLGVPGIRDRLLQAYRDATPECATVFAEVRDVLVSLRERGIRTALLTDNPPASQRAKIAAMGDVSRLFDVVIFTREHGKEKPCPTGFLLVAEQLGLPPSSLLMVGDNVGRDAIGAIEAGYAGCMLVARPGTRFHVNMELLAQVLPDVSSRVWEDSDLRALPFLCNELQP